MTVVAIVGVLAALAIYGVGKYIHSSKTSEAKSAVGAIARSGVAAYERVRTSVDALTLAGDQANDSHDLCGSSTYVPQNMTSVKGRKYQPAHQEGSDFYTGDDWTGWRCLRYEHNHPIYYQLHYCRECGDWSGQLGGVFFVAQAQGDADGDGIYGRFLRGGQLVDGELTLHTALWLEHEDE